ncbi:hypothetical protein JCM5353_003251 [Sporobolomyces roseus]
MVTTQSSPPVPKAASGIHASRYAKDSKDLISLMNNMRAAGVGTELDLPRNSVEFYACLLPLSADACLFPAGNQSAGKSSLVEAISGIKVPRDAGTCTRCPFEVRLQHSDDPWYCKISLRFETGDDGRPLETIREIPFGDLLRTLDGVESALRRAQLAILNPSVSANDWAKASDADVQKAKEGTLALGSKKQFSFSTNLVCIDISGPEVTDLAFLDLPGIISNVEEGEDPANIDLIKGMVDKVIEGNCLILLTLSMKDDIENQSAMLHARKADPEGKRTIGVLTKADTLQEGEHQKWLQILLGQKHKLSNGYFATRLPGTADLGKNLTFEAARDAERNFFTSTAPWSTISSDVRRRLGIPLLTAYLSEKLSSYIKSKLPEIRQVVLEGLQAAQQQVDELPPPPSDEPLAELLQIFQAFRTDLDAYVVGNQNYEDLIKEKNRIQRVFANNVNSTRPLLHPYAANDPRSKLCHQYYVKNGPVFIDCHDTRNRARLCLEGSEQYQRYVVEMNLTEIRIHIEERKTRETPLNTPFPAKSSLMVESTKGWPELVYNALESMETPVSEVLAQLVAKHFGRYEESGLAATAKDIVFAAAHDLGVSVRSILGDLLNLEKIPFTLNNPYYEKTYEKVLADFKDKRKTGLQVAAIEGIDGEQQSEEELVRKALSALAALGYNAEASDLPKLLPTDEYADEIDVAAHVIAKWTVAYKRIIDNVPRLLDYHILQKLPGAISQAFVKQLAHNGKDTAAQYLSEGFELQEQRAELQKKITRIGEAKQLLASFGRY